MTFEEEKMFENIRIMEDMDDGWNSYDAPAPSYIARRNAIRVLKKMIESRLTPMKISPMADGGVALQYYGKDWYASIDLMNDGEVLYGVNDNDSVSDVGYIYDLGNWKEYESLIMFVVLRTEKTDREESDNGK